MPNKSDEGHFGYRKIRAMVPNKSDGFLLQGTEKIRAMVFDMTRWYLKIFLHIFHILNNVILSLNQHSCIAIENTFILVFKFSKSAQN